MRLWHYKLLPYLPDAQFKGQLRELVAIMHDWRDKGETNHLLINRVMDYPKSHLTAYFLMYRGYYYKRYNKDIKFETVMEFVDFSKLCCSDYYPNNPFDGWHNEEYLRVCMANLYEKNKFGVGRSRITDGDWQRLCDGYREITGSEYAI